MRRGSNAISAEEKALHKEKERRIHEAERMLIPASKSTAASMHLVNFDPAGTFHLEGDRWTRVYKIQNGDLTEPGVLVGQVKGRIRITKMLGEVGDVQTYLTLTESGEDYDEIRTCFSEEEKMIRNHMDISQLSVDEAMSLIKGEEFSFASTVRRKRDWKKECFSELAEEIGSFRKPSEFGECLFAMRFPEDFSLKTLKSLAEMGCRITFALDFEGVSLLDQVNFSRNLEQRYHKRTDNPENFMNQSLQIMVVCDSDDARSIIEKTIISILSKEGFVMVPCYGNQRETAESIESFGILSHSQMRNLVIRRYEGEPDAGH